MSRGAIASFVGQTKRGADRLDMKNGGGKNFSSFIWTLVVGIKIQHMCRTCLDQLGVHEVKNTKTRAQFNRTLNGALCRPLSGLVRT